MPAYLLTTKNFDREGSDEEKFNVENSNEKKFNEKNYVQNMFVFLFKTFQLSKLFIKCSYNFPIYITHMVKLIVKA